MIFRREGEALRVFIRLSKCNKRACLPTINRNQVRVAITKRIGPKKWYSKAWLKSPFQAHKVERVKPQVGQSIPVKNWNGQMSGLKRLSSVGLPAKELKLRTIPRLSGNPMIMRTRPTVTFRILSSDLVAAIIFVDTTLHECVGDDTHEKDGDDSDH